MDDSIAKKLADLETTLGLLQRDYETQNEMILLNTRAINQLEMNVRRLLDKVESLGAGHSPTNLDDEKPPHY